MNLNSYSFLEVTARVAAIISATLAVYLWLTRDKHIVSKPLINSMDYHIVVASFKDRDRAVWQAKKLVSNGYMSRVILNDVGMFSVTLGEYSTKESAMDALTKAKQNWNVPNDAYVFPPERWRATIFP